MSIDTETIEVQIQSPVMRKPFVSTPGWLFEIKGLSSQAKWLYVTLLRYAWQTQQCYPGYARLMEDMECSRNTLAGYIRELKRYNLLETRQQGLGQNAIYILKDPYSEQAVSKTDTARSIKNCDGQEYQNLTSINRNNKTHNNKTQFIYKKDDTKKSEKTSKTNKPLPLTTEQEAWYAHLDQLYGSRIPRNARNLEDIDQLIGMAATPANLSLVYQDLWDDPENNHWWRKHLTLHALVGQYPTRLALIKSRDTPAPSGNGNPMSPEQRLEHDLAQYNANRRKQKKPEVTLDEFRQLLANLETKGGTNGTP